MTSMQILTILMSMSFAVAFTAQLRKLFTKPDGSCPIDGKWVYLVAAVFGVAGKVLSHYAAVIPPIVWEVLEPLIGTVLAMGAVQAFSRKGAAVTNIPGELLQAPPSTEKPTIASNDVAKIIGVGALIVGGLCAGSAFSCWAASPACKVVDAIHESCIVFNYLGPDGAKQTVTMTREEAAEMGHELAVKKASASASAVSVSPVADAGCCQ